MNVLVLYDQYSTHTNTVFDHLSAFSRHSRHQFAFCHGEGWVPGINWQSIDALVIHYSLRVAYEVIRPRLMKQISSFTGLKILFVQDEYDFTERTRQAIGSLGIDVVFTCVPAAKRELIYPTARFSTVRFVETLTGFVPDQVQRPQFKPIAERAILVGYRGRALPYWYGDLGQEKQLIAEHVKSYCQEQDIPCDIEWDDSHRIYGDQWLAFLSNCKATLGTESGSNVFDFDGSLRRKFTDYLLRHPKASYQEARLAVLGDMFEEPIMNQVSPRIFESVACGTALVLFEGSYSGVVEADRHFIPLKKDFSNIDEVFRKLGDNAGLQAMTERAYADVIGSGRYTFASFVANFDEILEQEGDRKQVRKSLPLNYSWEVRPHPQRIAQVKLPRWLANVWRSIPLNLRLRMKPAARRLWDFVNKK